MKTITVQTIRDPASGWLWLEASCDGLKASLLVSHTPPQSNMVPLERAWLAAETWIELHGSDRDKACTWAEGYIVDAEGHGHYAFTRMDGHVLKFGSAGNWAKPLENTPGPAH